MSKKEKYTFEQWCIDNNNYDLLNRWDYEKTGFAPCDITFASAKPVYFKCPKGLHESEKRKVYAVTTKNSEQKTFVCKECQKIRSDKIEDLNGRVFGNLEVVEYDAVRSEKAKGTFWKCVCSCGNKKSVKASHLKNGSIVSCGDRRIHRTGENNSNWKGGVTSVLQSKRTSREYNEWRDAVYAKDWYTCQCCGAYGDNVNKNAHHIVNFSEYAEFEYDIKNGICLCEECHHIRCNGSFHNIYGTRHNTSEQLEEYINKKRKLLGINIPFTIDSYQNGNILKPDSLLYNYIKKNNITNLCSILIPLRDAERIWSEDD